MGLWGGRYSPRKYYIESLLRQDKAFFGLNLRVSYISPPLPLVLPRAPS